MLKEELLKVARVVMGRSHALPSIASKVSREQCEITRDTNGRYRVRSLGAHPTLVRCPTGDILLFSKRIRQQMPDRVPKDAPEDFVLDDGAESGLLGLASDGLIRFEAAADGIECAGGVECSKAPSWSCEQCTLVNAANITECDVCGVVRGAPCKQVAEAEAEAERAETNDEAPMREEEQEQRKDDVEVPDWVGPSRRTWSYRLAPHGSVFFRDDPDSPSSGKIAGFDFDGTLNRWLQKWPSQLAHYALYNDEVPGMLHELHRLILDRILTLTLS